MLHICLRRLVTDLLARRTGFIPQAVHMRSVVVKMALRQVLRLFAVSIGVSCSFLYKLRNWQVANTQQTVVIH